MKDSFKQPTIEEIVDYLISDKNYEKRQAENFADRFWNFYESKGWLVGKNKMKSWKAAIRTWELNQKNNGNSKDSGTASSVEALLSGLDE